MIIKNLNFLNNSKLSIFDCSLQSKIAKNCEDFTKNPVCILFNYLILQVYYGKC